MAKPGYLKRAILSISRGKLAEQAKRTAKTVIKEAYWAFAQEDDEHNERLAVFYFKPEADDDVVVAKVEGTLNRMGQEPERITRHRKKDNEG